MDLRPMHLHRVVRTGVMRMDPCSAISSGAKSSDATVSDRAVAHSSAAAFRS